MDASETAEQARIRARAQVIAKARGGTTVTERDLRQAAAELAAGDVVEEASMESFPASDAPAWTAHPHPTPDEEPDA